MKTTDTPDRAYSVRYYGTDRADRTTLVALYAPHKGQIQLIAQGKTERTFTDAAEASAAFTDERAAQMEELKKEKNNAKSSKHYVDLEA